MPELSRELTSESESRRECLSRSVASLGRELGLGGVEACSSFARKQKKQRTTRVNRGVVRWRPGKCCCWEGRGGGGDVLRRM